LNGSGTFSTYMNIRTQNASLGMGKIFFTTIIALLGAVPTRK